MNHFVNLLMPALAMATWLAVLGRGRKGQSAWGSFWVCWAVHLALAALVIVIGLVWFGRDGKVATYAALVVASATLQWALQRGRTP